MLNGNKELFPLIYDHTTLKAPVIIRSLKLSCVGPAQYLDGDHLGTAGVEGFLFSLLNYALDQESSVGSLFSFSFPKRCLLCIFKQCAYQYNTTYDPVQ